VQAIAIARATFHEMSRRRTALVMLVVLPLAFYLARRDVPFSAVVVLALGLGWAVSTLSLFSTVNALELDSRLRVAGFTTRAILVGRLLAVMLIGLALSMAYLVLVIVDQDITRLDGVVLMMLCALELTLFMTNPDKLLAHCLPLWSVRGVADWTTDLGGASDLRNGLAHAAGTLTLLLLIIAVASAFRLRIHPPHAILSDDGHTLGSIEIDSSF
jgi:hypothetical protein